MSGWTNPPVVIVTFLPILAKPVQVRGSLGPTPSRAYSRAKGLSRSLSQLTLLKTDIRYPIGFLDIEENIGGLAQRPEFHGSKFWVFWTGSMMRSTGLVRLAAVQLRFDQLLALLEPGAEDPANRLDLLDLDRDQDPPPSR